MNYKKATKVASAPMTEEVAKNIASLVMTVRHIVNKETKGKILTNEVFAGIAAKIGCHPKTLITHYLGFKYRNGHICWTCPSAVTMTKIHVYAKNHLADLFHLSKTYKKVRLTRIGNTDGVNIEFIGDSGAQSISSKTPIAAKGKAQPKAKKAKGMKKLKDH